jgi:hypothetical protein
MEMPPQTSRPRLLARVFEEAASLGHPTSERKKDAATGMIRPKINNSNRR